MELNIDLPSNEHKEKLQTKRNPHFFNSLSNIPMLDLSHLVDDSFYKTTYREDFIKKERVAERKVEKPADFSVYNKPYDYKELSSKLTQRKQLKNANSENDFASDSSHELTKSSYWYDSRDPEASGLFDSSTETRAAFNGNFHVYKRPVVPSFIKRDHFYQTNSEKNLTFMRTNQGILIPIVPDTPRKDTEKNSSNTARKTMMDNFFLDKLTESQCSFSQKEPLVSPSKIMSHLRRDHMYHSNASRNIRFVKTSNGGLINYVPVDPFESASSLAFNDASQLSFNDEIISAEPKKPVIVPYDNNHLKIKLRNPENESKRNFSVLQSGPRSIN